MKRLAVLCLFALYLVSFVHMASAQPQNDAVFELPQLYNPAKIVVQYAYTVNFSVTNVRTLGYSLWTVTGSPVGVEFNAKQVDTYEFDLLLRYNQSVDQCVQVAIWSGTLAPASSTIHIVSNYVKLHFKLVVTEQPKPATPDEVAAATMNMVHQELLYYMDQITLLSRKMEQNLLTQWVIIGATAMSSICSLLVSIYVLRRERE